MQSTCIELHYGTTLSLPINVISGLDLTSCSAVMHIRTTIKDTTFVELSTTNGAISIFGQQILINFSTIHSTSIADGSVYDLLILKPSGEKTKLIQGKIKVVPSVTRGI